MEDILYVTVGARLQNGTMVKAPIRFGYGLFLIVVNESGCPEDLIVFMLRAVVLVNEVILQCVFLKDKGKKIILLLF